MVSAMRKRIAISTIATCGWLLAAGCTGLGKQSTSTVKADKPPEKAKPGAASTAKSEPAKAVPDNAAVKPVKAVADAKSGRGNRDQLDNVGAKLAAAASDTGVKFQFDVLYNPRPKTHHSDDGHIYISSGMLEELKTPDDLATVLALEMSQFLAEKRAGGGDFVRTSLPSTGPGDDFRDKALAAKMKAQAINPEDVRSTAQQILGKAGYRSANVAAVREKIQRFAVKPELPSPRDPRLKQVFAN